MADKTVGSEAFKCPSCGADMKYDPATGGMHCSFCDRTEMIEAADEQIEEYDFDSAQTDASLQNWGTQTSIVQCSNCGGTTVVPAGEIAVSCAFCGSAKVVSSEDAPGIKPESLIPFKIDDKKAVEIFDKWLKKRKWAPFSMKKEVRTDNLRGVYLPYWSYDSNTKSTYTGQAGDYYHTTEKYTETVNGKTETRTKQVKKTRWRFVSGTYDKDFDDIIFSDSKNVDDKRIKQIEPFRLNELVPYNPRFLAGFAAERYSKGLKEVWERAKKFMGDAIRKDIREIIKKSCDEVGTVNVSTTYADIKYKHMLLPVWISAYTYGKKVYNFYINGQTGTAHGKVPKSVVKIGGLLLILAGIAVALYFILR